MVKSDSFEPDYNAEDTLRNRLVTQFAQEPSAAAPPDQLPAPPQPSPQQQTNADVAPTNESYQAPIEPQAQTQNAPSQLGFTTPEAPRYAEPAPSAPAPAAAPAGNNPTQYSRQMEDQWINFVRTRYGGQANGNLNDIVANYNNTFGTNARVVGSDKVDFGFGPADVIKNVSPGGAGELWLGDYSDPTGISPNSRPAGAAGPGAAANTAAMQPRTSAAAPQGGSFGSLGGSPQGIWGTDFLAQLRQMLMQRLQSASGPVDENASGITQAVTGARDQATRANDASRTALAERLYAQGGLNTDAIGQSVQQSNERTGTALGTLRAQLVMKEMDAKRTELKDLMSLALQSGDAEMARGIQMQLAELEAQLRREGYDVQREGIGAQLGMYQQNQNNQAGSLGF